jgi:antitoxin component YwqK of YwqJK toxin-antitoxin module
MRLISAVSEDKNLIERREPKPYELEIARVALGSEIKKYRQPDGSEQWNYFLDGILRMRATIRNGERHGSFELFYPNGFVWIKGGYKDNEPADDWEAFLPNGEKLD